MPEITSIPPKTDQRWKDVATGKISHPWESLALKIMMTRINNTTKSDPSSVDKCAEEVYAFFEKNMKTAQHDLALILS